MPQPPLLVVCPIYRGGIPAFVLRCLARSVPSHILTVRGANGPHVVRERAARFVCQSLSLEQGKRLFTHLILYLLRRQTLTMPSPKNLVVSDCPLTESGVRLGLGVYLAPGNVLAVHVREILGHVAADTPDNREAYSLCLPELLSIIADAIRVGKRGTLPLLAWAVEDVAFALACQTMEPARIPPTVRLVVHDAKSDYVSGPYDDYREAILTAEKISNGYKPIGVYAVTDDKGTEELHGLATHGNYAPCKAVPGNLAVLMCPSCGAMGKPLAALHPETAERVCTDCCPFNSNTEQLPTTIPGRVYHLVTLGDALLLLLGDDYAGEDEEYGAGKWLTEEVESRAEALEKVRLDEARYAQVEAAINAVTEGEYLP